MAKDNRTGWIDFALAGGLALGLVIFYSLFGYPYLHPDAWNTFNIALGLRPPASPIPGLWQTFVGACVQGSSIDGAEHLLTFISRCLTGGSAAVFYLLLRETFPYHLRIGEGRVMWEKGIERVIILLGSFTLGCADPIWRGANVPDETALMIFLALVVLMLVFRFFRTGNMLVAAAGLFLAGLFTADSPLGVILALFIYYSTVQMIRSGLNPRLPLCRVSLRERAKWHMTAFYALGLVCAVAINISTFVAHKGAAAAELDFLGLMLSYVLCYWQIVISAATTPGWVLVGIWTFFPIFFTLLFARKATDEDAFMPYRIGLVFLVLAAVTFTQLSSVSDLWFWTWVKYPTPVRSPFLLATSIVVINYAFTLALAVLAVDLFGRDHIRIAQSKFHDDQNMTEWERQRVFFFKMMRCLRFPLLVVLVGVCVYFILPGRMFRTEREICRVIRDYVHETLAEAKGRAYLFADGVFDAALEIEARRQNLPIHVFSLAAGKGPYDRFLRERGITDPEDRLLCECTAVDVLRTWVEEKPVRRAQSAYQLAFDMWSRVPGENLVASGLLAAPAIPKDEAERGRAVARDLYDHVFAVINSGDLQHCSDAHLRNAFDAVQAQLVRMARFYAGVLDRQGEAELSLAAAKAAETLENANPIVSRLCHQLDWISKQKGAYLTPREGLRVALDRSDFILARRYAEPLLAIDPEASDVNYALGMCFLLEKQYARAEFYFRKALVRNPDAPAIWHPLARALYRAQHFEEALRAAARARELSPDSEVIAAFYASVKHEIDTLKTVKQLKKNK